MAATLDEMAEDLMAHAFLDDPKLKEEVVDDELTPEAIEELKNNPDAWAEVFNFRQDGTG